MNRLTFYCVMVLSIGFVAVTLLETWMYQTWDMTVNQEKDIQLKLANAQRIHQGAQQLLRRMAIDSQRDPALLEILKKNNIKVNITTAPEPPAPPTSTVQPSAHP